MHLFMQGSDGEQPQPRGGVGPGVGYATTYLFIIYYYLLFITIYEKTRATRICAFKEADYLFELLFIYLLSIFGDSWGQVGRVRVHHLRDPLGAR